MAGFFFAQDERWLESRLGPPPKYEKHDFEGEMCAAGENFGV